MKTSRWRLKYQSIRKIRNYNQGIVMTEESAPKKPEAKKQEASKEAPIQRNYSKDMVVDSDLFKLSVANLMKNVAYNDANPILVPVEHCHFFRTFDSSGKKQVTSNAVGGHYHNVTICVDENGKLSGKCGPAIGSKLNDAHVHEIEYIRSSEIELRKINPKASQFIANFERV